MDSSSMQTLQKYVEESFIFLKEGPIPLLSQFISWINLDLGTDGDIAYFSGCHRPLFIVALLVLIFLIIPYTLFLVVGPIIEAYLTGYKCFCWVNRLKPVMDAYGGPYSDKFRVWTGFLLLV